MKKEKEEITAIGLLIKQIEQDINEDKLPFIVRDKQNKEKKKWFKWIKSLKN